MSRRQTRGEAEMDSHLQRLEPGSERYVVLHAARRFKASWVELGQHLTASREKASFRTWGFPSFEAYCRRELRLRQETANKLTRSFAFLRDHQPTMLAANQTEQQMPPLDVVDLLSQARDRTAVDESTLNELQQEAFAPEGNSTRQGLLKKLREHDPQAFREVPQAEEAQSGDDSAQRHELRKALLLAERLESLLSAQQGMSEQAIGHAHSVVTELRERFARGQRHGAA